MTIFAWDKLFLLLFLHHVVECSKSTISCNSTVSLSCDTYNIIIVNTNTSSTLSSSILEQCNAHQQCHVSNVNRECIWILHWCKMSHSPVKIKEFSDIQLKTKQPFFSLMSLDYSDGRYQRAANVNCTIETSQLDKTTKKKLMILIYEFAPFIASSKYCLSVAKASVPPFCSSSSKLYSTYGPFYADKGWQFHLRLKTNVTEVPMVRYWIDLDVNQSEALGYQLTCHSRPVYTVSQNLSTRIIIAVTAAVGSGLIATLAAFLIWILFKKTRKSVQKNTAKSTPIQSSANLDINNGDEVELPPLQSRDEVKSRDIPGFLPPPPPAAASVPLTSSYLHLVPAVPPRDHHYYNTARRIARQKKGNLAWYGVSRSMENLDQMESGVNSSPYLQGMAHSAWTSQPLLDRMTSGTSECQRYLQHMRPCVCRSDEHLEQMVPGVSMSQQHLERLGRGCHTRMPLPNAPSTVSGMQGYVCPTGLSDPFMEEQLYLELTSDSVYMKQTQTLPALHHSADTQTSTKRMSQMHTLIAFNRNAGTQTSSKRMSQFQTPPTFNRSACTQTSSKH